eukprot:evm.model.NODE_23018_length_16096_cov_20.172651.2
MLLIEALPNKNPLVLDMASSLSKITTEGSGNIRSIDAKGSKGIKPWPEVQRAARSASGTIAGRGKDLIKGATDEKAAQAVLNDLNIRIDQLDYPAVPQLLGRAEIEITTRAGKTRQTRQMYAVLDGYSAPLSAGQFVDLAQKKAFDDTKVVATDESSVTFTADAAKAPKRTVPLEIFVVGDKEPTYGESLEEQGRFKERTVLPFNAYGTIAMLHPPDDPNGGANSFFFLKADPSYTPAGLNTLDGAFSVVGVSHTPIDLRSPSSAEGKQADNASTDKKALGIAAPRAEQQEDDDSETGIEVQPAEERRASNPFSSFVYNDDDGEDDTTVSTATVRAFAFIHPPPRAKRPLSKLLSSSGGAGGDGAGGEVAPKKKTKRQQQACGEGAPEDFDKESDDTKEATERQKEEKKKK